MSNFADYIADALTSHIAGMEDCADLIYRGPGGEIVYFDIEAQELFLITVEPAHVVAAEGKAT